jgi:hypothetical protein
MFVAGVVVHVMLVDVVARRLHMNDFGKFYYAARLFLDGPNMYEPSPATFIPVGPKAVHVFLNLNPPHFHLLVLPLSVLPVETAGVIWQGGTSCSWRVVPGSSRASFACRPRQSAPCWRSPPHSGAARCGR